MKTITILFVCSVFLTILATDAFSGKKSDETFVVRTATSMEKIFRDSTKAEWINPGVDSEITFSACRGESESFQVVVLPRKNLSHLRWEIASDLKNGNIEVQPVGYLYIEKPLMPTFLKNYPMGEIKSGWWPDPLYAGSTEIEEIKASEVQPIWVTVDVPRDARPGTYNIVLTFSADGTDQARVTAKLKVWNFELPDQLHLKTSFWYATYQLKLYYPEIEDIWGLEKKFLAMALHNRVNPITYQISIPGNDLVLFGFDPAEKQYRFDFTGMRKRLTFIFDEGERRGNPVIILWNDISREFRFSIESNGEKTIKTIRPFTSEGEDFIVQYLSSLERFLKENNWNSSVYLSYVDEPGPKVWDTIRWLDRIVKKTVPRWKTLSAINHQPSIHALKPYIDSMAPGFFSNFNSANSRDFQELQSEGRELWGYICYKTSCINYQSLDHRIWTWLCWKYDMKGLLYWGIHNWSKSDTSPKFKKMFLNTPSNRWPYKAKWEPLDFRNGVPGDGYLIYPSPEGEPWSSIRLENIRDGVEDYEYFSILKDYVLKLKNSGKHGDVEQSAENLLEIEPEIINGPTDYTHDYTKIIERREKIGDMIEYIKRLLKEDA
ncbi:MAG: glycoside hydrolase domain-containing protein [Methylococcaceae bacterium]